MINHIAIRKTFDAPYRYGFSTKDQTIFRTPKGLDKRTVEAISKIKGEPVWMLRKRMSAFRSFNQFPFPSWGPNLTQLPLNNIYYYARPSERKEARWKDVPKPIRATFDRIGIPEYERRFLAGAGAQYDSENVYQHAAAEVVKRGVVFSDIETACKKYPHLVQQYFGTVVPADDNKFAALNSAVWSGGSFIYVPKGVHVKQPLQAYFRINAQQIGQFERTLIIADEGSFIHYIEGCSAPIYRAGSLHCAVVEIIAKKNARVRYTTIQNWSKNVFNLVTKRAYAHEHATVEWVDFNFGSRVTMKYPAVILAGHHARADLLSMAFAGHNQQQDTGAKAIHQAPGTTSRIISKSIASKGGKSTFRGTVRMDKNTKGSRAFVQCHSLILDRESQVNTYPNLKTDTKGSMLEHEASVSQINEEQLFYLQSRGLTRDESRAMLVNGFIEPLIKELPMEYAVEMNRLIQLEMETANP